MPSTNSDFSTKEETVSRVHIFFSIINRIHFYSALAPNKVVSLKWAFILFYTAFFSKRYTCVFMRAFILYYAKKRYVLKILLGVRGGEVSPKRRHHQHHPTVTVHTSSATAQVALLRVGVWGPITL